MEDANKMELAMKMFDTFCNTMDELEISYKKNKEEMRIECVTRGDDLPMELSIRVLSERRLVLLLSKLPFVVSEEKRLDVAIAVSAVNNILVEGCFDYDILTGHMIFRMSNSFCESLLSKDVCVRMFYVSNVTIDEFNDKFLMLSKGLISVEKFLATLED